MGKLKGFLEFDRIDESQVNPSERIKNYSEFTISPSPEELNKHYQMWAGNQSQYGDKSWKEFVKFWNEGKS